MSQLRNPYQIPTIDSIGIDIWTMDKGIIFDNIVVDKNPEKAIQGWDAARLSGSKTSLDGP
jgi:hypothetical protein